MRHSPCWLPSDRRREQSFGSSAGVTYIYDGLDRRDTKLTTTSSSTSANDLFYVGTTDLLSRETSAGSSDPDTNFYAYDSQGQRLGSTTKKSGQSAGAFDNYDLDASGSVVGIENPDGSFDKTNGSANNGRSDLYRYDPYGQLLDPDPGDLDGRDAEAELTDAADQNPFRFEGFYYDSGIQSYDMQAREYRPDIGRFLSQDRFQSAGADLHLQSDPLTQNRYAFAGGNPVSNVEWDGHSPRYDGSGGNVDRERRRVHTVLDSGGTLGASLDTGESDSAPLAETHADVRSAFNSVTDALATAHALPKTVVADPAGPIRTAACAAATPIFTVLGSEACSHPEQAGQLASDTAQVGARTFTGLERSISENAQCLSSHSQEGSGAILSCGGQGLVASVEALPHTCDGLDAAQCGESAGLLVAVGALTDGEGVGAVAEGDSVEAGAETLGEGGLGERPGGPGDSSDESSGPRKVAIGEDMNGRVIPRAREEGAEYYDPPYLPPSERMAHNGAWINQKMDEGCTIIDCGPAPGRDKFPEVTSPYYQMELDEIARRDYPYYHGPAGD